MKIGFIIPVLNAADSIAGLLMQINGFGKAIVIEYIDPFRDVSESERGKSVDDTHRIVEKFDDATFMRIGKVADKRTALNKGLQILDSSDYFVILQQGDYLLNLDNLLEVMKDNDVIVSNRIRFWRGFERYYLERDTEFAFRNMRGRERLRYTHDPFHVNFANGKLLNYYSLKTFDMGDSIANFAFVTSTSKVMKLYAHNLRTTAFHKYGKVAADCIMNDSRLQPEQLSSATAIVNAHKIEHPWVGRSEKFFSTLPSFPALGIELWDHAKPLNASNKQTSEIVPSRVLLINARNMKSKFESEGWEVDTKSNGKYDLIVSIGQVPIIRSMILLMKANCKLIMIDTEYHIGDPRMMLVYLEENDNKYSYVLKKKRGIV
jgi:hypothetical protein